MFKKTKTSIFPTKFVLIALSFPLLSCNAMRLVLLYSHTLRSLQWSYFVGNDTADEDEDPPSEDRMWSWVWWV